jgi:hypothetical protein
MNPAPGDGNGVATGDRCCCDGGRQGSFKKMRRVVFFMTLSLFDLSC